MSLFRRLTRSRHIHRDVDGLFRARRPAGRILDLPAGDGVNARRLAAAGYQVVAADLFASDIEGRGLQRVTADMAAPLPFADGVFDGVLCSEGIEHLDAQLFALQEMARVLKPGGVLVVTTPNVLHLAARASHLATGHAHPRRAAVAAPAQYWGAAGEGRGYFGHAFLINFFQLRFYLEHTGFEVLAVDTARWSLNAVLLSPLLYPVVWWGTRRHLARPRSKLSPERQKSLRRQVLSAAVLFGRKLVVTALRRPEGRRAASAAGEGTCR